jgi:hypothetical protein
MPIYVYECPVGHSIEFLKLKQDEAEPEVCEQLTNNRQSKTKRVETFKCGLPLTKIIGAANWKYTRGKNVNWPLTDPVNPTPKKDEVY